jgi:MFS family permease
VREPSAKPAPRGLALILTVFLPFGCGYYISYLFRTVNAVISENLTRELGIGPADLGLLTSIYLITFASSQIPLGVALDRYGPRRVNAALLLVAATGAAVFAWAESYWLLLVGRGLIGLGVSAALMGAFKANAIWFPAERLPLLNNLIGAFGAVGAISATRPVEILLHIASWREIFAGLAVLTVIVSLAILALVPERRDKNQTGESIGAQIAGFRTVIRKTFFWRIALIYSFGYSAFVVYQTLWADAWLRDIAGLAQTERANYLLLIQIGFLAGLVSLGVMTDVLRRSRIQAVHVFGAGVGAFILLQVPLALGFTGALGVLWSMFGLMSASVYFAYAVLTKEFPPEVTGRAITAMNFLVFVAAFVCQWGVGGIIEAFPRTPAGGYPPEAHATALGIMLALQGLSYLYFVWPRRSKSTK